MHKITETGPAFCVCAGGLSVCLLYRVSLATSLVTFAAAVLFILYCAFVLSKGGEVTPTAALSVCRSDCILLFAPLCLLICRHLL